MIEKKILNYELNVGFPLVKGKSIQELKLFPENTFIGMPPCPNLIPFVLGFLFFSE